MLAVEHGVQNVSTVLKSLSHREVFTNEDSHNPSSSTSAGYYSDERANSIVSSQADSSMGASLSLFPHGPKPQHWRYSFRRCKYLMHHLVSNMNFNVRWRVAQPFH